MAWYRWHGDNLVLTLQVRPRASRDEWAGSMGDAYKVRIKAPPVNGKANAHLIGFLAKTFGVARSRDSLLNGSSSRCKVFRIDSPAVIPLPIERP